MARSMIARQNIKLNLVPGGVPPVLNVSQYDSAYDVHFTIYNGAQLFEIPDDVSIQFQETKRDGNGFTVGATKSAQPGQCYIWMQEQMSAVPGDQICELVMTNTTEDQIGTENFILRVEPAALNKKTVISESEIAYANQVLAQLGSVAAYKEQLNAQGNEIDQLNTNLAAEVAARQAADNTLQSNINSEASIRATADAALQSQINQLIAPEGAAPSAAEVENARVGADGAVYPTLGDAIRGQVTDVKDAISGVEGAIYPDEIRSVVPYPFGTGLTGDYVWMTKDVYIPQGTAAKLVCINKSNGATVGRTYHVVLLGDNGNDTFKILSDTPITVSTAPQQAIYIPESVTADSNVHIGFYSADGGILYQSSGDRRTEITRYTYTGTSVGDNVTPSGSYNLDFAFGLYASVPEPDAPGAAVVVDVNGSGDYTSVLDAMQAEPEGTVIFIKPGVYNQDMTACLKKRVILIGADRNQCIIRDTDGRYGHHPLYVSCGYFSNLTIEAPFVDGESQTVGVDDLGAYAVHIDTDEDYAIGKQCEFHHCNIRSDFFPAVGLGMRKDATYIFDDCTMENGQIAGRGDYSDAGSLGALYFHDSNGEQGDQYLTLKNCVLKSKLKYAMCPYMVNRTTQNNRVYCNFISNVLYSDVGHYTDNVWFRRDPFNPDTGIFSIEIGYGNSISTLNNA